MTLFDECFGHISPDPRRAEGLVRRTVERARRLAANGVNPTGVYADIAAVQDTAAERTELAARIGQALAAGDRARASRLIEVGCATFGLAAMAAAVEGQAREAQLNALQAAQERWEEPVEQYPEPDEPDILDVL